MQTRINPDAHTRTRAHAHTRTRAHAYTRTEAQTRSAALRFGGTIAAAPQPLTELVFCAMSRSQ